MDKEPSTITKKAEKALSGLQEEFSSFYNMQDFTKALNALKAAGDKSDRSSKLKRLFKMLDSFGIQYERGMDNAYYEDIVQQMSIPTLSESETMIEARILCALYRNYREYPTPEAYMKRLVDRLSKPEDQWAEDSLRVRILKQFVKYGNCMVYEKNVQENGATGTKKEVIYGGEAYIKKYLTKKTGHSVKNVLEHIDCIEDDVFDVLPEATKPQKKPKGTYGLLKMVDDLASGQFRTGGGTKKSLYYFAMVYGMTYYSGDTQHGEIKIRATDIEDNLFCDYYANNLMRFITDAYQGKLCEFELDPSGQGINYKNFAEMVYLYYITRNIPPQEKVRLSSEMISEIQTAHFQKGNPKTTSEVRNTSYYRKRFKYDGKLNDTVKLSLSEDAFKEYIGSNYDCDTAADAYSVGEMQLSDEQNTAYTIYCEELIDGIKRNGMSLENCNYGLWLTDVAVFKKIGYEKSRQDLYERIYSLLEPDEQAAFSEEEVDRLIDLLSAINSFMGYTAEESVSDQNEAQEWSEPSKTKTKALYVQSASFMTRTSMIVAFYYLFNAMHESDEKGRWSNFGEYYNEFAKNLNDFLNAAHYQPMNKKNIFDVLVAFSSYVYVNM